MEQQEGPVDIVVHYDDGASETHRRVTGDRARELENLAFTAENIVSTETKDSAARPHPEFIDFHRALDELTELVDAAGDAQRTGKPLAALGLAAHARDVLGDRLGALVGSARLTGASWEAIGRELGLSKQTAYNRFVGCDPTRWDGTSPRCAAAGLLDGDTEPCEGDQEAVKIFEASHPIPEQAKAPGGTLACVRHGAKLYARINPARALVYPVGGPNRPDRPAITVYTRAQQIREGAGR